MTNAPQDVGREPRDRPVSIHITLEMAEAGAKALRQSGALAFSSSADILIARDVIYAALTKAKMKVSDALR